MYFSRHILITSILYLHMSSVQPYEPKEWEHVNCLFCGADDSTLYEKFGYRFQYSWMRCKQCGLFYVSPRPKYDKDFTDAAYATYYQYVDGLSLDDLSHIKESSMDMFRQEVDYIVKHDKHRTAVLDIGCGMGTFLYPAKEYYAQTTGLDISVKTAAFVKEKLGIDVYTEQFENYNPGTKFSLIHMSHVMEHIPDPNRWVSHAADLLEKEGILAINIPNKMGYTSRIQHFFYKMKLKKQVSSTWANPTRTPDHLFEPTIKSMKYLLAKHSFKILEYYTYSRKDPTSCKIHSRFLHRLLKIGNNMTFICTKAGK